MKHIFFFLLVMTGVTCTKTENEEQGLSIVSTWRLSEFIVHQPDGSVQWQKSDPAQQEEIRFSKSGDFSSNLNFPWHDQAYDKYNITDSAHLELSSLATGNKATFYYRLESSGELIFNPVCRENCNRKYVSIE